MLGNFPENFPRNIFPENLHHYVRWLSVGIIPRLIRKLHRGPFQPKETTTVLVGGKTTKMTVNYALPFEAAQCGYAELR